MPGSRKLGRPTDHRKSMLRGMVTFLLENGKIETTVTRAKEVRAMTEKMITLGKNDTLHSKRQVLSYVTKEDVVKKLFDEIAPKYADRNGGYCRIIKTGPRRGEFPCDDGVHERRSGAFQPHPHLAARRVEGALRLSARPRVHDADAV